MDLATFRATSKPVKSVQQYRPLTGAEEASFLKGNQIPGGDVCHANYLRMCVQGAENVADGLYLIEIY